MRRIDALMTALLLTASLVACGVPADHAARLLSPGVIPPDFTPSTVPSPTTTTSGVTVVQVYFVAGGILQPVTRTLPAGPPMDLILRQLLRGPTDEESANGVTSAINVQTRLLDVVVRNRVALVDVSTDFVNVSPQDAVLAVAQLVYSVTEANEVDAMRLLIDGRPVEVPRQDGTLTKAPVDRSDYQSFLAPS